MKKLIFIIGLLGFQDLWASQVVGDIMISQSRNFAVSTFRNISANEVYCDQIKYKFQVIGDEFGETIGEFEEIVESVYLQPKESVTLNNLGKDLKKYSSPNRVAVLSTATSDFSSCRTVTFSEYCNYVAKDPDEVYTITRLFSVAKTSSCEDLERQLGEVVDMKEAGVSNLKPFTYLPKIQELDLSRNKINSVEHLKNMRGLKEIILKDNPVQSIDVLVTLPNILEIDARDTNVTVIPKNISPSVKRIRIKNGTYRPGYKTNNRKRNGSRP